MSLLLVVSKALQEIFRKGIKTDEVLKKLKDRGIGATDLRKLFGSFTSEEIKKNGIIKG